MTAQQQQLHKPIQSSSSSNTVSQLKLLEAGREELAVNQLMYAINITIFSYSYSIATTICI